MPSISPPTKILPLDPSVLVRFIIMQYQEGKLLSFRSGIRCRQFIKHSTRFPWTFKFNTCTWSNVIMEGSGYFFTNLAVHSLDFVVMAPCNLCLYVGLEILLHEGRMQQILKTKATC
jgi:hypothetical protein